MSDVDELSQNLKTILYDAGVNNALTKAQATYPVLALPIISVIFKYIVTSIASSVFGSLDRFVMFNVIAFKTAHENAVYESSVDQLRLALKSGSTEAIANAKTNVSETLKQLVNFDITH